MLRSTIYVSRNLLIMPRDADQLSMIRLVSAARNRDLGLTGIIIVTRSHFAQYLEGEPAALVSVMDSIRRDGRHTDLTSWDPPQSDERRFPSWRMAFFGPNGAVSHSAEPILVHLNGTFPNRQRDEMMHLIQDLSNRRNELCEA